MIRWFLCGVVCAWVALAVGGVAIAALVFSREDGPLAPVAPPPARGPYEVQLVYALPADGDDRRRDHDGTILASVEAAQRWLEEQTGGQRIGFTGPVGRPTILRARLTRTQRELGAYGDWIVRQIELELRAQGFAREGTLYAVYYEGTGDQCGLATATPPEAPATVMALILDGLPDAALPCGEVPLAARGEPAGYWEFGLLHEIFHLLGAVPDCAPHEGNAHYKYGDSHVDEPGDLMYHGPDAATVAGLDIGHDDYYGHGRFDCFDAARSPYLRPVAPDAEPPPRGFAELRLAGGCTTAGMASAPEWRKLPIYVANTSAAPVELRWIDGDGQERHYDWLPPWESVLIHSPIGTTWVIADAAATCLTQFTTPEHSVRAWYHGARGN